MLALSPNASGIEDPPNCSLANGGAGSVSQGGINFDLPQAHVGDTVPVFPSLGKVTNSCKAINATGTVYIATGLLTNFLVDVTLNPGLLVSCPDNALCQPGPYNLTITPALVGAAVNTPLGGVPGLPKTVRAVENGSGTVQSIFDEQLSDFHSRSIQIVTPCLQILQQFAYPAGPACFPTGERIRFTGSVSNCGDIALTNVVVMDDRAGAMQLLNPADGSPLVLPVSLTPGAYAVFSNSFLPTPMEVSTGSATNTLTATGTDTTAIGGPRATVTNRAAAFCDICAGDSGRVHYVDLNSANPTPPFTSWPTAATNIQDAVDVADAGDEIVVTNGVYQTGGGAWQKSARVAVVKPLAVRSVNGPEFTVVVGSGNLRCAYVTNGASLSGFTFTGGTGGGVLGESISAVVSNSVLAGNSGGYGAGAF